MASKRKINPVLIVSLIAVLSKLVGMFRDVVLANYFGTSNISDAYLIASSVPTLLFYFIGHSISTAYIPMYNKAKCDGGEREGRLYTNRIINIAFVFCTVFVVFLLVWPQAVIKIFAAGFDAETVAMTAKLIRISAVSMYLLTLISVLSGYLNANRSFIIPAAIGLPRNAVIVASIVVAAIFGIEWLGWGLLISYAAELVLLLPFAFKKGYRYRPTIKIKDPYVKDTWYVVVPILVGMCVGQVNKIIDRSLASVVCEGGVSALTYASVINNAVQEILVTGIITVLFSQCAEWVVKGEHEKVKVKLQSTLNTMIFLLVPATVGVIILARPLVALVLGRGKFDEASILMTSGALCCYTSGLLFLAARDTLVKVFYAYKKTKTTTIISIAAILINIAFNFILYHFIGLNGLAIATVMSAMFNAIVLYALLRKQIGDFGLKNTAKIAGKSLIACTVMGGAVFGVKYITASLHGLLSLVFCAMTGMGVYFLVALLLRVEPMIVFLKSLKAKKKIA